MRSLGIIGNAGLALCLFYGIASADTVKFTVALDPAAAGGQDPQQGTHLAAAEVGCRNFGPGANDDESAD